MPFTNVPEDMQQKMHDCVIKVKEQGHDEQSAVAICYSAIVKGDGEAVETAKAAGFSFENLPFPSVTVKAVGDWELDVRAVPFGTDRDKQTFDANTDYMLSQFPTPVIIYHHGMAPGIRGFQDEPVVIGKTISIEKRQDGVWIRVLLDKSLEFARRVWEAAKRGLAVASSDSIAHYARLEVNGKPRMYDKDTAGRISVWPLAGVSLWDAVAGNLLPASPRAVAMPVMKAVYREAGIAFPGLVDGTGDAPQHVSRTRTNEAQKQAARLISKSKRLMES